ncbi:dual OB domain-containing protein [Aliinostoc sp. HNIBRCY26]|uniref:dual OB domain-containing protein n=1 Tax=Aliinostoc sp. HNIBRCY26 TaxID=3418997 RepID=UPI003D06E7F9
MFSFEIVCLAKSIKYGGICIAGIKTDGSGWLRPVSNRQDGTLYPEHYTLEDGREPELFDIIRIPCLRAYPKCHQPENWLIDTSKDWEILENLTLDHARSLLNPEIQRHSHSPELLGSLDKEICYENLERSSAQSSLALIKPESILWQVKINLYNEKKFRCLFFLCGTSYDLPITDPIWVNKLSSLEEGIYSCEEVIENLELCNFERDQFRLTISLSEPFIPSGQEKKFCYKLVAAVINVADVKYRLGWK